MFDRDYQYDPEQELPARMEELVTGFHRQRAEPLRLYVRRLDALVVKLRELKIEWPEPFLGSILLYRSTIPAWQIPNVRSSMGKGFSRIAVRDALYHMFGPDSKPNSRDVLRVTEEAKHTGTEHVNLAADDWADEGLEENHEYEFDEWHEWHEDDVYTHDTCEDEQPDAEEHESVPEDLESAADQVEEAFATWQEMRVVFFPVTNKLEYMQAPAWVSRDGSGHKGKSKGKGGGKPRSYGKKAAATRWRKGTGKANTGAKK